MRWPSATRTRRAALHAAIAREHFGALATLRVYRTPAQAIGEISAGSASAAMLPHAGRVGRARRLRLVDRAAAQGRPPHPRHRPAAVLGAPAGGRAEGAGAVVACAAFRPTRAGPTAPCLGLELPPDYRAVPALRRRLAAAGLRRRRHRAAPRRQRRPGARAGGRRRLRRRQPTRGWRSLGRQCWRPPIVLGAYASPSAGGSLRRMTAPAPTPVRPEDSLPMSAARRTCRRQPRHQAVLQRGRVRPAPRRHRRRNPRRGREPTAIPTAGSDGRCARRSARVSAWTRRASCAATARTSCCRC